MNGKVSNRDNYIDIVKAIGIISIVIGHSSWLITKYDLAIGPFVYSYHIMIFMFIGGYSFNIKKANEDPNYKYYSFGKQIIKFAKLFFIYGLFFAIIHNTLISMHVISGSNYGLTEILIKSLNSFSFSYSEVLLCAFWFVQTLLITKAIFTITYSEKNINKWYRFVPLLLGFMVFGLFLCSKNIILNYRMQISILSVPIMYLGVLTKKHWNKIQKYITPWAWIICAITIYIINYISKTSIELSVNRLINPFIFYPLTLVGIYFCLSLAEMVGRIKILNSVAATIGKYSFHIMALHFLVIKVIDVVYSKINGIIDIRLITQFPNSYSKKLFLVYYVLGIALPTLVMFAIDKIKNKIKS